MKFKKILSTLLVSTMVFSIGFSASAKEAHAQEAVKEIVSSYNVSDKVKDSIKLSNDIVDLNTIQGQLVGASNTDEIRVSESISNPNNKALESSISPLIANDYYWSAQTAAFTPSAMVATDDIDIVWNRYQPGNEGAWDDDYQPAGYPSLQAPTYAGQSAADFKNSVSEGHVNDYLGAVEFGSHSYYTVLTGNWDTITAFASKKVRVRIADMSNNTLVFDSGYNTNGDSYGPGAGGTIEYVGLSSTTSFGTDKRVYSIKFDTSVGGRVYCVVLSPYNPDYPTTFDQVDNLDPDYHYAFYSGKPLPGRGMTSLAIAHNSSVSYNGSTSFNSPTSSRGLSLGNFDSQRSIFAVTRITVNESIPSQNNWYISSLSYKFKWPDGASFYTLSGGNGTYSYSFNQSVSPIGTWQFMYSGTWKSASNTSNSFSGLTSMTVEYLAPYGYAVKY